MKQREQFPCKNCFALCFDLELNLGDDGDVYCEKCTEELEDAGKLNICDGTWLGGHYTEHDTHFASISVPKKFCPVHLEWMESRATLEIVDVGGILVYK